MHYLRYWVDEGNGKIFCLVDAPTPNRGDRPPRGPRLVADEIYQVREGA